MSQQSVGARIDERLAIEQALSINKVPFLWADSGAHPMQWLPKRKVKHELIGQAVTQGSHVHLWVQCLSRSCHNYRFELLGKSTT
jgi:hypothetical protein